MPVLYDLVDLSRNHELPKLGHQLYATAGRAGNVSAQLDILRLMSSAYKKEDEFKALEKLARALPASQEQKETILFLQMKALSYSSKFLPEAERQKEIARLIEKNEGKKTADPRARLLDLYTVVEYLRNESSGEMLESYLNRLVDMVNSQDFQCYAIQNCIYSEAANIYSDAGDHERAVAAERKLLEVIAGLEKKYAAQGREYRNYDRNKYISYRRMLRNFEALRPGEADSLYKLCASLAERNLDAASDFTHFPRIHAYYNMATGQYAQAIPYLKKFLDSDKPGTSERRALLNYLATAAEKTGDEKTRLEALAQYTSMLEEFEALRSSQRYKELQIRYDIADLRERNAALELEASNREISSMKRTMSLELTAFGLLLVVLVAFLFYWSKFQRNTYNMGRVVDRLASERNRIRRSLYFDYADDPDSDPLGDEEADHWRHRLKKKHKRDFEMSTFMTEALINDLLYIAAVSRTDRRKYMHDISADRLMREAIREAAQRYGDEASDFQVSAEFPEDDFRLETDPDALRSVMAHIIEVAARYAVPGQDIQLSCLGHEHGITRFAFTTPTQVFGSADEPRLFDLFIDSDQILENRGSGLLICRIISLLINCDFKADRTWRGPGSRFILTVPDETPLSTCQTKAPKVSRQIN